MKWLTKLKKNTARKAAIRKTENALSRMSDYNLKDIGLTRGDIRRIARSTAKWEFSKEFGNI